MAQIAETKLDDVERASDLLSRAVDLAPDQPEPLRALCELYQRSERFDDLVELLRERVLIERNADARAELHRRIAQVVGEHLNDVEGAIDAWRKLLQIKEDREALSRCSITRSRTTTPNNSSISSRAWPRSRPTASSAATCCSNARAAAHADRPAGAGDRRSGARADRARLRASSRRSRRSKRLRRRRPITAAWRRSSSSA